MPRVQVPRHVARLVERLVARLIVDNFDYAARPGASACRAARHAARRAPRHRLLHLAQARRQLLRLRRTSGCLGTSRGSSPRSSSTTSPRVGLSSTTSPTPRVRVPRHIARLVTWLVADYFASRRLVVDYFAYAARPGASTRRVARHATHRRLLHLAQARRRLLSYAARPVPRHVARLVARLIVDYFTSRRLVVDYFAYTARPGALARRAARQAARRRLLLLEQAHRRLLRLE
jgi:hypothetical protein